MDEESRKEEAIEEQQATNHADIVLEESTED